MTGLNTFKMKNKKTCIKCGNKSTLNHYGVCKDCENYDQNKNNSKN